MAWNIVGFDPLLKGLQPEMVWKESACLQYNNGDSRPATHTDFHLLSVYTDFLHLEFGKIQILSGIQKGFLYIFTSHTNFFPTIQIFLVIYTDFVLDQSGRSVIVVLQVLTSLEIFYLRLEFYM